MKNLISTISSKTTLLPSKNFYTHTGVIETPLLYSSALSEVCNASVFFKCENIQTTGSFKIRGATSALLNLTEIEKEAGVITASSGNHGAGTAAAAKSLGIPVTIYVPENISLKKEKKITSLGATLVKVEGSADTAEQAALTEALEKGLTYISPYNHQDIIAGQGTIGFEILKQMPRCDAVIASVGGGGLVSGIGALVKSIDKKIQVIGALPENAPAMKKCVEAGEAIEVPEKTTLSDGTAGGIEKGSITISLCSSVVDTFPTVSEQEIAQAMHLIKENHSMIVEGAAGVAVAALMKHKDDFENKSVCVVLCGSNISDDMFNSAMEMVTSCK